MTTAIFSHGQESGPWGTKIRAMSELAKGLGGVDFGKEAKPEEILAATTLGVGDIMQRLERRLRGAIGA